MCQQGASCESPAGLFTLDGRCTVVSCRRVFWRIQAGFKPVPTPPPPSLKWGAKTKALVEFADIYPTLCDLTGLPKPKYLEGSRALAVIAGEDTTWLSDSKPTRCRRASAVNRQINVLSLTQLATIECGQSRDFKACV